MLPKKSTPVDQNLESESIHSQLSVAIFRAPRSHLISQNDNNKKCPKKVSELGKKGTWSKESAIYPKLWSIGVGLLGNISIPL